jgi:hypothetical protein
MPAAMGNQRSEEPNKDKPANRQESKSERTRSGRGAASALEALRQVERLRDRMGRRTWPPSSPESNQSP